MKHKKQLLEDVLKIAKENIPPSKNHLDISLAKGKMLAKEYNADIDFVTIGICLMDIKLSEAHKLNKTPEHVKMASDFAKEYLEEYDLTKEEKNKLINCIEAHHGKIPFTCIEAEICANADCYRFIHPFGVFTYAGVLAKRTDDFKEQIKQLKYKLNEKHDILSLSKAKEDLERYYEEYSRQFDEMLEYFKDMEK